MSSEGHGVTLDINELTESQIQCPSCRFGKLAQTSLHKWECSSCGYWTVRPPTEIQQRASLKPAGGFTPRTREQTEELRRGREYWGTLTRVGKKAVFGFLMIFTLLSFALNMAVRAALNSSLSLTWTIASWATAGALGIVSLLLFFSSSGGRKAAFIVILSFFIITGAFWFDLAQMIARI